jgi:multidrug resistance efflux pump
VQGYVIGVAPEVAGNVTRVAVANNTDVEAGQLLFEIDPAPYRIALARAESELENARRQVEAGNAAVEAARANLDATEANRLRAQQDYERLKRLRENDAGNHLPASPGVLSRLPGPGHRPRECGGGGYPACHRAEGRGR